MKGKLVRISFTFSGSISATIVASIPGGHSAIISPRGSTTRLSPEYETFGSDPTRFAPTTYAWFSIARATRRLLQW